MTTKHYRAEAAETVGMSLTPGRMVWGHTGQIIRIETGEVVHRTRQYPERRTALLQAGRLCRNYEYHLAKHGIGWEDQQSAARAAKQAEREAERKRVKALREAAPDLLAALVRIVADWDEPNYGNLDMARDTMFEGIEAARVLIKKTKGEA